LTYVHGSSTPSEHTAESIAKACTDVLRKLGKRLNSKSFLMALQYASYYRAK